MEQKGCSLLVNYTHNMRKLFVYTGCCFFLLFVGINNIQAQEIRTNAKGEKIIVYPDGSWKYFNKKSKVDPFGSNQIANIEVAGNGVKKSDDHNLKYFLELGEEALVVRRSLKEQLDVENRKYNSLRQKQQEYFDGLIDLDNKEIEILNRQLYKADLTESLYISRLEQAEKLVILTDSMQNSDVSLRNQLYDDYLKVKENLRKLMDQEVAFEDKVEFKSELDKTEGKSPTSSVDNNCNFAFDGKDPLTGKLRRTIEPDFLFSYTPENLSSYFTEDDMVTCSGSITELGGGKVFLLLELRIKSPNAKNAYGGIGRGSILTLKTFEGEQIRLVCTLGDDGHYNDIKNVYTFRAQYPMSKGELKVLRRSEIDQARIVWKTGYEDYEVLNVDFFINQFNCLK